MIRIFIKYKIMNIEKSTYKAYFFIFSNTNIGFYFPKKLIRHHIIPYIGKVFELLITNKWEKLSVYEFFQNNEDLKKIGILKIEKFIEYIKNKEDFLTEEEIKNIPPNLNDKKIDINILKDLDDN